MKKVLPPRQGSKEWKKALDMGRPTDRQFLRYGRRRRRVLPQTIAEVACRRGLWLHGLQEILFMSTELVPKQEFVGKKTIAGILGILLGAFGIHKFMLGNTTPGLIMLISSLLCIGYPFMSIIGLVEGIMYLTKSDDDFYEQYAVEKKGWF
jgi:TM2 domain-containing membrane protein YozV